MSERGVTITIEQFEQYDDWRSPLSRREAYIWLGLRGPVPAHYGWLARQWRWANGQLARKFVYKMVGSGLFKFSGKTIEAVGLQEAVPAPMEGNWAALRTAVFARDGFACTYCGSANELQCDHIFPRAKGGTDVFENLTTACRSCNASKRDRLLSEWRQ